MSKIGLILEGGGMRGAYTAGCLAWFVDHNIEFDYSLGISSGAVYLASYWLKNKTFLDKISTEYLASSDFVGLQPLLSEGALVGYKTLMSRVVDELGFDTAPVRDNHLPMEFGVYNMNKQVTEYYDSSYLDDDLTMLRAACTLPIAGRIVEYEGKRFLDGGITKMVPIDRSIEMGCDKHFVIMTKPYGYVRKPGGFWMNVLMKLNYFSYNTMCKDYSIRHLNYADQVAQVEKLQEEGKAIVMRPSRTIAVSRFSGDPEKLKELYALGYQDMEDKKEEILKFMKKEAE